MLKSAREEVECEEGGELTSLPKQRCSEVVHL